MVQSVKGGRYTAGLLDVTEGRARRISVTPSQVVSRSMRDRQFFSFYDSYLKNSPPPQTGAIM